MSQACATCSANFARVLCSSSTKRIMRRRPAARATRYRASSRGRCASCPQRFEHRLFLTATPHNGHSNSFSALLEMLDPQRFTARRRDAPARSRAGHGAPPEGGPASPRRGLPGAKGRSHPDRRLARGCTGARSLAPARRVRRAAQAAHRQAAAAQGCAREARLCRPAAAAAVLDRGLCPHAEGAPENVAAAARRASKQQVVEAAAQTFVDGSTTDKTRRPRSGRRTGRSGARSRRGGDRGGSVRRRRGRCVQPPTCARSWPLSTTCWRWPSTPP